MSRTVELSVLVSKGKDEIREAKERLFRALVSYNEIDYLTENEQEMLESLKADPGVQFDCRNLLTPPRR